MTQILSGQCSSKRKGETLDTGPKPAHVRVCSKDEMAPPPQWRGSFLSKAEVVPLVCQDKKVMMAQVQTSGCSTGGSLWSIPSVVFILLGAGGAMQRSIIKILLQGVGRVGVRSAPN